MTDDFAELTRSLELDQMATALVQFAKASRIYYDALREQGFKHDEALTMTELWQAASFAKAQSRE